MRIQIIIAMVASLFVMLWTGIAIGNGEYAKAGFVGCGTLFVCLLAIVGRKYRFEGWFIAIVIACYFVGGKGFAYQRVSIIFVGEITLCLLMVFHMVRCLSGQNAVLPRHPMTVPLLLFQVYGFIHLMIDKRYFDLLNVLKDTATVYYGLFFFLVFPAMLHKPTRDYVLKLLPIIGGFALLVFAVLSFIPGSSEVIIWGIVIRGAPLVLPSVDSMIPICIGVSAFCYFKSLRSRGVMMIFYMLAAIVCTVPLFSYGKAVFYLAFFAYACGLIVAGHWRFLVSLIPVGAVTLLALIALIESGAIKDEEKKFQRFVDEFSSFNVAQIGATGQKHGQRTVEWRFTWWKMITEDVMREAPLYGLGMGADISSEFHAIFNNKNQINVDQTLARYPHNIVFTILGRMGWIGILLFIPICLIIIRELWIGFLALRRRLGLGDPAYAFAWGFVLAGFTNAFFQSTFEAPYTAVMFWAVLAILAVLNQNYLAERKAARLASRGPEDDPAPAGSPPPLPPRLGGPVVAAKR